MTCCRKPLNTICLNLQVAMRMLILAAVVALPAIAAIAPWAHAQAVAPAPGVKPVNIPELLKTLRDEHALDTDLWIYNDLNLALTEAKTENKPLFVTFRCVPCKACAGFDAEVAQGSDAVDRLAREKFIAVRQVEMKGVDLNQFEFDFDLSWAAMFLHPDGTVYARYGTQSAAGPDAYNSTEGLLNTMQRVLELHADYPANRAQFEGKRSPRKPYVTALEMPGLPRKEQYRGPTTWQNCIHCHNIHDALHFAAQAAGNFDIDLLYRYPLPDNVGLVIDPQDGVRIAKVIPNTPAARAGFQPGEKVLRIDGQAITSIADMQWALNPLPNADSEVSIEGSRSGKRTVKLVAGWKASDFSWRGSIWSVSPRLKIWLPEATEEQRRQLKLESDHAAFQVRYIADEPAGRAARAAGLQVGDFIVALDGKPIQPMTSPQFNAYIKLRYKVGDRLPVTIVRGHARRDIQIQLVE